MLGKYRIFSQVKQFVKSYANADEESQIAAEMAAGSVLVAVGLSGNGVYDKYGEKKRMGILSKVFMVIVIVVIGIVFSRIGGTENSLAADRDSTTIAEVTEVSYIDDNSACFMKYAYQVDGETYNSKLPYYSSTLCKYDVGENIKINYEKELPQNSGLAGFSIMSVFLKIGTVIFIVAGIVVLSIVYDIVQVIVGVIWLSKAKSKERRLFPEGLKMNENAELIREQLDNVLNKYE